MPSNSSRRLDETMATEIESLRCGFNFCVHTLSLIVAAFCFLLFWVLVKDCYVPLLIFRLIFHNYISLSSMDSMWNVMELLSDMLQAVNPSDREVC